MSATDSSTSLSAMASELSYAVACWGGSIRKRDAGRLDRLVRKAGSIVGSELEAFTTAAEKRTLSRLNSIMDNDNHLFHPVYDGVCPFLRSPFDPTHQYSENVPFLHLL